MSLNSEAILDAVVSHAMSLGVFERVNQHEPKNAPGNGITAAVWIQRIRPAPSGLSATSAYIVWTVRLYVPMMQEPQDQIDPAAIRAVDALLNAYTGEFELGLDQTAVGAESGTVRCVDLLGNQGGEPLSAEAGYIEVGTTMYRSIDVTVPVIVNDVWTQEA